MKFLVDAQLPRRLAAFLASSGHDAVHTSELSLGNRTPDHQIAARADHDGRVVITKDRDFWVSHVLHNCPRTVLIVATGNITNSALVALFADHLDDIVELLAACAVVEMSSDRLVGHADKPPIAEESVVAPRDDYARMRQEADEFFGTEDRLGDDDVEWWRP
ncbi:DUF5615 family PIN-like protein [Nocardia sp. NPDC050710]|uniref:DUF5615 family PIN-like protein n=1 Tax=Nocardia sp. NPDC050710 TaxID=3157220 RepID=UPI00340D4BA3